MWLILYVVSVTDLIKPNIPLLSPASLPLFRPPPLARAADFSSVSPSVRKRGTERERG